jgi:hypothetical protein
VRLYKHAGVETLDAFPNLKVESSSFGGKIH